MKGKIMVDTDTYEQVVEVVVKLGEATGDLMKIVHGSTKWPLDALKDAKDALYESLDIIEKLERASLSRGLEGRKYIDGK